MRCVDLTTHRTPGLIGSPLITTILAALVSSPAGSVFVPCCVPRATEVWVSCVMILNFSTRERHTYESGLLS